MYVNFLNLGYVQMRKKKKWITYHIYTCDYAFWRAQKTIKLMHRPRN